MQIENTPTLETKRLILRKFKESDVDALYDILSDSEVNLYLPWFPLNNKDEALTFLHKQFLSYYTKEFSYRYAICLKEENIPIGYICISLEESHDLGYAIKKEFWHKGIVTEAANAVVEQFKKAGYPYITATHDVHNIYSGEVMKKLNMKYQYSYVELWQPKNILVTFKLYQINFTVNQGYTYMKYWNQYETHFIEDIKNTK